MGDQRNDIVGVVLTGGQSRRMGVPKCDLVVGGRPVVARLCELLAARTREVVIVGRRPREDRRRDVKEDPGKQSRSTFSGGACTARRGDELRPNASGHVASEGTRRCEENAERDHDRDAAIGVQVRVWGDEREGMGPLGGIATALKAAARTGGAAVCVVACDSIALEGRALDFLLAGRDERAGATVLVNPRTGRIEPMPGIYEAWALTSIEEALRAGRLGVVDWLTAVGARRLNAPDSLADELLGANTPEELAALERRLQAGPGRMPGPPA